MKYALSIILSVFFISPLLVNAQSSTGEEFFNSLDTPNIIKNNVRITSIEIKSLQLNSSNEIEIEGIAQIVNNADTPSSRLYMSAFAGIKGQKFYTQYPFYTYQRSEAFVLAPKETISKEFKFKEKNFLKWGNGAVEVWIMDEYNKTNHKQIAQFPYDFVGNVAEFEPMFTDFISQLTVGNKNFPLSTGPTFYPDSEDMFLTIKPAEGTAQIFEAVDVKIFDRNFFTSPVKEFTQKITLDENSNIHIPIPKDLKPGVYPIEAQLSTNNGTFIPRLYGRFIVGGNMGKTTDVVLNVEKNKLQKLTLVVQGNPPDITNQDRESQIKFDAEISILDKNDKVIFTQQVQDQSVDIYRNIEIELSEKIDATKIKKVQVNLSDANGIFSTYEKEFSFEKDFSLWNVLLIFVGIMLVFILVKIKNRHTVVGLVMCLSLFGVSHYVEAGMNPSATRDFGILEYDALGNDYYNNGSNAWVKAENDSILDAYGIDVTYQQPNFNSCFAPGQFIPVVVEVNYGLCANTPLSQDPQCEVGEVCGLEPDQQYLYASIEDGTDDWFWDLRDFEFISASEINTAPYTINDLEHDDYKKFDLDYLENFFDLINASVFDNSLKKIRMDDLLGKIENISFAQTQQDLSVNFDVNAQFTASGTGLFEHTLIAPEQPGAYNLRLSLYFDAKNGRGHYTSEHQIDVCNTPHDADAFMMGNQRVNSSGQFVNSNGVIDPGYTIQKYTRGITPGIISPDEDRAYYEWALPDQIAGRVEDPYNEFNFVTVANYCGARFAPASQNTWPSYLQGLNNGWTNFQTIFSPVNFADSRLKWVQLDDQIYQAPSLSTRLTIYSSKWNNAYSYYEAPKKTSPTQSFNSDSYFVWKDGSDFKFMNIMNNFFPTSFRPGWSTPYFIPMAFGDNAQLSTIPQINWNTFWNSGEMAWARNLFTNSTNAHIIKENLKIGDTYSTCSIYEDFCTGVSGVQYLLESENSSNLELWYIDASNNHAMVTTVPYNSNKITVDGMCALAPEVDPNAITASCTIQSPTNPNERNVGTSITFKVTPANTDGAFPVTYSWAGLSSVTDTATRTFNTTGSQTQQVTVTNGSRSVSIPCLVTIVDPVVSLSVSCLADPVSIDPGNTTQFIGTASGGTGPYIWTWSENSNFSSPRSCSGSICISPTYSSVGTKTMYVRITDASNTTATNSCAVTVNTGGSCGPQPLTCVNGIGYTHTCVNGVWQSVEDSTCLEGGDPNLTTVLRPNIVSTPSDMCTLTLSAQDVSSCQLLRGGEDQTMYSDEINSVIVDDSISTAIEVPVGTYQVSCTLTAGGTTISPYQRCLLNPDFREN